MFDIFIINKIKEEEERRRREQERPRLEVPDLDLPLEPYPEGEVEKSPTRGVLIIEPDDGQWI